MDNDELASNVTHETSNDQVTNKSNLKNSNKNSKYLNSRFF